MMSIAQDGTRLTGKPIAVPANLSFCDGCDCIRRAGDGWTVKKIDGYPHHFCPRHSKPEGR